MFDEKACFGLKLAVAEAFCNTVYAFLPMGVPASPQLVEQCEQLGVFFAGIMPHIHNSDDRILLQYINIPLDMDGIRVYSGMSRKLFAYITDELQRVQIS